MPEGQVENYQGAGTPTVISEGWDSYISVYNDTGASVPEGSVVEVGFATSTDGMYPQIVQPATNSGVFHVVGIVNNTKMGSSAIADNTWGLVQIRGYCPKVLLAGATTINHTVLTTNTSYNATSSGAATQTTATIGIAKTAGAGSPLSAPVWLYGLPVALT